MRNAIVTNARSRSEVEAYLPDNYRIRHVSPGEADRPTSDQYLIEGEDVAGWTLDGYVIPRFASGLISCKEIDAPGTGVQGLRGPDYTTDEEGQPHDVYSGEALEL